MKKNKNTFTTFSMCFIITVVKHIPTTTVIIITCVVGIPLFMIKKLNTNNKPTANLFPFYGGMIVVGI